VLPNQSRSQIPGHKASPLRISGAKGNGGFTSFYQLQRRWAGRGKTNRQLNELGGVKPLAFGQYGELGPRFEQLLDQLSEEGADERPPKRTSSPTVW
jgi:hypothetical protein